MPVLTVIIICKIAKAMDFSGSIIIDEQTTNNNNNNKLVITDTLQLYNKNLLGSINQ